MQVQEYERSDDTHSSDNNLCQYPTRKARYLHISTYQCTSSFDILILCQNPNLRSRSCDAMLHHLDKLRYDDKSTILQPIYVYYRCGSLFLLRIRTLNSKWRMWLVQARLDHCQIVSYLNNTIFFDIHCDLLQTHLLL